MRVASTAAPLAALLAAAFSLTSAAPTASPKVITAPEVIPSVFNLLGAATASNAFTFTMLLEEQNFDGLAQLLENSPEQTLTADQLAQYMSPTADNLAAVQNYLKAQGIPDSAISYNNFKNRVTVASNIGTISKLFSAAFNNYKFGNSTVAQTPQYTIPTEIAGAVNAISPLANFARFRRHSYVQPAAIEQARAFLEERGTPSTTGCNTAGVTPTCLRNLYGTYDYKPTGSASQTDVLIAGFIGQYYAQADLQTFMKTYRPDAANANVPVINAGGAINLPVTLTDGVEAMLDTETIVAATYPLKSTYYNYGTQASQGDIFEQAISDISNNYAKYGSPGVYSVSYGADESSFTQAEANAMCRAAGALSAQGVSIIVASGDNGVGGSSNTTCPPFQPDYPVGCPYITAVGATQNFNPEVAVDPSLGGFYSGSGFSNFFPRPSFQNTVVPAYKPPANAAGKYNPNGRAYPDVSAQGSKYNIQAMNLPLTVSGTSASTPTFASVIALIKDLRRTRKLSKLNGYINPTLYNSQGSFNDVTKGNAYGCKNAANTGFSAATGWDPVGGLGTPKFDQLRAAFGVA